MLKWHLRANPHSKRAKGQKQIVAVQEDEDDEDDEDNEDDEDAEMEMVSQNSWKCSSTSTQKLKPKNL